MKTLPTQERALIKRNALIQAATKEFSRDGFELATAKSIAAAAGVATGTFYQYFENKNDILCVIAQTRFEAVQQRIRTLELYEVSDTSATRSAVEAQFLTTLEFVYEFHASEPELHQVLEQRRASYPRLRAIMDNGEAVLHERVLNFVQSFNQPNAEVVANNLFAMAEGLVHRLVFNKPDTDPQKSLVVGAQMLASFFAAS